MLSSSHCLYRWSLSLSLHLPPSLPPPPPEIYLRLFYFSRASMALSTLLENSFYKTCLFHWGAARKEDKGKERDKGKNIGRWAFFYTKVSS